MGSYVYGVFVLWCDSWCPFQFNNHLAVEERAGCFILGLIVIWLSAFCVSSSWCRRFGLQTVVMTLTLRVHAVWSLPLLLSHSII